MPRPKMWTTDDGTDRYLIDLFAVNSIHHHRGDIGLQPDELNITIRGAKVHFFMPREACKSFVNTYLDHFTQDDDPESDDDDPFPHDGDPSLQNVEFKELTRLR